MDVHAWTALIAGAYAGLFLTMVITAALYGYELAQGHRDIKGAHLLLFLGITISFGGHALDQLLWATSNIHRAINDATQLILSEWVATEIPYVVVLGKFLAAFGAMFHIRLFCLNRLPWMTIPRMTAVGAAVVLGVAVAVY